MNDEYSLLINKILIAIIDTYQCLYIPPSIIPAASAHQKGRSFVVNFIIIGNGEMYFGNGQNVGDVSLQHTRGKSVAYLYDTR